MRELIIVGKGLAANILALRLKEHQLGYTIIGEESLSNCSRIAAGLWNPIVFKRMTNSWKAGELIAELEEFYTAAEKELHSKFYHERTLIKPFFSEEEKNFWIKKTKGELKYFTDPNIYAPAQQHKNLAIPDEYGIVNHCGNIDVQEFLNACEKLHLQTDSIVNEVFDHAQLKIESDHVTYKGIKAKGIVFCEGHLVKNNPFFNWLPMNPVKGEIVDIEAEDIGLEKEILNHNAFIFRSHNNSFKVGSTYEWNELNEIPTEKRLSELKEKLKGLITSPYRVLNHRAGIRPSTLDRRPIIGAHPQYKNVFVFNGLGTKGVMLAPYLSKNFVYFYLNKSTLNTDVNIKRYYPKFRYEH
jgi:glycine oxidase